MLVLVFTFVFYTLSWQVVKYGAHPHQVWDYFLRKSEILINDNDVVHSIFGDLFVNPSTLAYSNI